MTKKIFICNNTISLAITVSDLPKGCSLFAILRNDNKRLLVKDLDYTTAKNLLSKGFQKLQQRDKNAEE